MAKVLGIGGIFFKSPDPKRLSEWYARVLGLAVGSEPGVLFEPRQMPEGSFTVWSTFDAETSYFSPSDREFMFNLVVDNLEEALEQVREGGGQIVGEIEKYDYGKFGWFIDPDGNKVELWEPARS